MFSAGVDRDHWDEMGQCLILFPILLPPFVLLVCYYGYRIYGA